MTTGAQKPPVKVSKQPVAGSWYMFYRMERYLLPSFGYGYGCYMVQPVWPVNLYGVVKRGEEVGVQDLLLVY